MTPTRQSSPLPPNFFDAGHSLKDQRLNRRSHLPGYAAWEIHPVMKIEFK
jgi:hypothetical protein